MYLAYLVVVGNSTDEAWPESIWNVIRNPESPQWRLVVALDVGERCFESTVLKNIRRLRILSGVWHEGRDNDVASLDDQGHLEFLQQTDVLVFERFWNVPLSKEGPHFSNSCTEFINIHISTI